MALPTVEKTWEYNVNNSFGGTGQTEDHQDGFLLLYNTLLGFSNNPWTMIASSDGSTSGYPGPGWQTRGDIITGYNTGAARSWAVLERPISGDQLLMHMHYQLNATDYYRSAEFSYSPGGNFTGGSTTSEPSATDLRVINHGLGSSGRWLADQSTAKTYAMHALHSTDGKHTYIFFCYNNLTTQMLLFSDLLDAPASWTKPWLAAGHPDASAADLASYSNFYSLQRHYGSDNSDNEITASFATLSHDNSPLGASIPNPSVFDATSQYPITTMLIGTNGANGYGILGRMPDIWGGSTSLNTGDTHPDDGSRTFCQFGDFLVPWNGTIPVIA